MQRLITLTAGLALGLVSLTACGSDSKSGAGGTDAFCAKIKAYAAATDITAPSGADSLKTTYTSLQAMVHDMQKSAPAEVKKDIDLMATSTDSIVAIFEKYNWDETALNASSEVADLFATLNSPETDAAQQRLNDYSAKTCDVTIGS